VIITRLFDRNDEHARLGVNERNPDSARANISATAHSRNSARPRAPASMPADLGAWCVRGQRQDIEPPRLACSMVRLRDGVAGQGLYSTARMTTRRQRQRALNSHRPGFSIEAWIKPPTRALTDMWMEQWKRRHWRPHFHFDRLHQRRDLYANLVDTQDKPFTLVRRKCTDEQRLSTTSRSPTTDPG